MRLRIKSDEPCSSKSQAMLDSPISPVGRIAKRNACLLNGLDLKSGGSYAEGMVGTIPDFNIRAIQECVPAITSILDGGRAEDLRADIIDDLQKQLENLLAENIDYQRNITGEMSFLTTGDYPTDDLSHRLMPDYELREVIAPVETKLKKERSITVDDQIPSCSKAEIADDEEVVSDAVSSMEEDADNEPYCVLDIPHRFWTWSREYLGHVDAKFIKEFEQEFYQRYHSDYLTEMFVNEPFKYRKIEQLKNGRHLNGNSPAKKPLNGYTNGDIKQNGHTNGKTNGVFKMVKNLVTAYVDEYKTPKKQRKLSLEDKTRNLSILNRFNGYHSNGMEPEQDEDHEDGKLNNIATILSECYGNGVSEYDSEESRDSFLYTKETSNDEETMDIDDIELEGDFDYLNINEENKEDGDTWDEVSLELLRAQKKLSRLSKKTTATLVKSKRLLEAEHSHWVTSRLLNKADEELFAKVDKPGSFDYEACVASWMKRQEAFQNHYMVEFVQNKGKASPESPIKLSKN